MALAFNPRPMDTNILQQLQLRPGGAVLEMEPLSDTGNAVPVGVRLQAPPGLLIDSFELYAPENPVPLLISVRLGTPQSSYRFDTRIRLAASQDIWLVAKLSDGSLLGHHAPTVLTSSACFDAS
jgi:predicted secreted protein